jgi:transcriptional regulator with XRE-family HTH domain
MLLPVKSARIPQPSPQAVFGLAVQRMRKEKKMTQEELASVADISPSYLSAVERGVKNVTISTIDKLAAALGVSKRDLF